ncbi:GOLPH3/VPS74 family protein [Saccharothrix sp. ST-888]|uniref:GOLPH3/VPS74 family protein n=1 Tax=Saccharothrix sp. ST-888 TaxID=1427391 RepID=UPI0009E1F250|nr:GPP34 family phosphoprotein [Saccharothrix sp. ST-888]
MELPDTLPGKLYLLAYDPQRERLTGVRDLDFLLRAAALTELLRRGLLREDGRGPAAVGSEPAGLDPVLAELLRLIREERPRSWQSWVARRRARTARAVRDGLAAAGWIRVDEYRVLGLFPAARVTPRDPRVRKALVEAVAQALHGPLSRVDPGDAALVALADAAQLRTVLTWRQRREFRARIDKLAPAAGPLPGALRRAIRARNAAAAS